MEYQDAVTVLNSHIFGTEKVALLQRIADNPSRFVGLFRPTKPQAKILQYLLQSNEIRFGDAMEEVIRLLIAEMGYTNLPRELISATGDDLSVDQYFKGPDKYYFIEQKVRDDHDSTKKRGQVENFEQKLDILSSQHPGSLVGAMFFIDPDLSKNKTFYTERLSQLQTNYNAELHLFYGKQMFTYLGDQSVWAKLIKWLSEWKGSLPDLPDLNLDASPIQSFEELKALPPTTWRRLSADDRLWHEGIIQAVFRDGSTIKLVMQYHMIQAGKESKALANALRARLEEFYPHLNAG